MRPPPERQLSRQTHGALKPLSEFTEDLCCQSTTYARETTIQHWQLRDLIQCPYSADEVFSVHRNRVVRHDLATLKSTTAATLTFEPTCMVAAAGVIAAGGQASQLDVRRSGETVFKGSTGGSVNNSLRVARDAGGIPRLFACNNDDTVKILGLSSGALMGVVRCPTAVNHCAVCPRDGKHLVCVGDDRHCYLYAASPTGYRALHVFTEASDAGMSCDWHPSGSLFAAASQDGCVVVWDARCLTPVTRFYTAMACRNVRFSPSPLDLMAFSEHRGRCHLADGRMWSRRQVLHLGMSPEIEPDVAGLAFSPCGRKLFVGAEDQLVAYDVDTSARRSFPCAEVL
jgi:WD40 repeat protein